MKPRFTRPGLFLCVADSQYRRAAGAAERAHTRCETFAAMTSFFEFALMLVIPGALLILLAALLLTRST
jgi:hypothetical protein